MSPGNYISRVVAMMRTLVAAVFSISMMGATVVCKAIDNPDAPDFVAEFNERAKKYEDEIQNKAATEDVRQAYAEYERFLDAELDKAYKALSSKLPGPARAKLKRAQDDWHKFRKSEFDFIAQNWTTKTFGSSSVLSRGAYRTAIIRERVTTLLHYLKNY